MGLFRLMGSLFRHRYLHGFALHQSFWLGFTWWKQWIRGLRVFLFAMWNGPIYLTNKAERISPRGSREVINLSHISSTSRASTTQWFLCNAMKRLQVRFEVFPGSHLLCRFQHIPHRITWNRLRLTARMSFVLHLFWLVLHPSDHFTSQASRVDQSIPRDGTIQER